MAREVMEPPKAVCGFESRRSHHYEGVAELVDARRIANLRTGPKLVMGSNPITLANGR